MLCPSCGAVVDPKNQKCDFCSRFLETNTSRPRAPQPAKFRVEDDGYSLTVSWGWFSPMVFFLIPFAIAWNTFLVGWYGIASTATDIGPMRIMFILFPLGHVAVGLGLVYGIFCSLCNRTWVRLSNRELSVAHGPLYFPGNVRLEASEIDQLYVTEMTARGDNPHVQFKLQARLRNNRQKVLLQNMTNADECYYLEQLLEERLKLRDERVAGEVIFR